MPPFHQLLSPPPSDSDREASVSCNPRLSGNMPLDYAIETDVKPIIRDFKTGAVLDPGGAGDKYVVDHGGRRFPYEILPDSTPSPVPKRARIKFEPAPYDRLQTVDIKSEDEIEVLNRTPMAGTRDSTRGRDRKVQARASPSDDDDFSSDDTGSSSSENSSSENSSSDESSSEESDYSDDSDSSSSLDGSVVDLSSVFRPSKSPSRFADTPSPTTRSQSRARKDGFSDSDSDAPSTPTPLPKKKDKGKQPAQATSVQRPSPLSFYIPIRRTDCQNRPSSPAPNPVDSTIALASSCGHGGKAIDKPKRASKSSKSSRKSGNDNPGSKDVRSVSIVAAGKATSRQPSTATAGPSTASRKSVQPSPQSQSSFSCHSPKGKQIATALNEKIADRQEKKRLKNKQKWKEFQDRTKAKKKIKRQQQQQQQELDSHANASNRYVTLCITQAPRMLSCSLSPAEGRNLTS